MNLNHFDAFSFDCYGTLIDWEIGLRTALAEVHGLLAESVSMDDLLESYAAAEAETERANPGLLYPEVVARSAIAAGAMRGVAVPTDMAARIGASVPAWPAFPDSTEALTRLQRHFKLIILSNVDRSSFAGSNARLGVAFDAVLTAQDIGSYKPDPRNFGALLAHTVDMGIAPGKLLHVAQSLFHDHVPAKAAGLPTVWIDRRRGQEGFGATPAPPAPVTPDWTFASMAEFADAVEAEG